MLSIKRWPQLLTILFVVSPSLLQANIDNDITTQKHHLRATTARRLQRQRVHEFSRSSLSVYIRCIGNNGNTELQRPYVPCKRGNRGNQQLPDNGNNNDNNSNLLETTTGLYTRGGPLNSPPSASPPSYNDFPDKAATKPPQSPTHHDLIQIGETLGGVQEGDQYGYSVQITSSARFIVIGSNKYTMVGGEQGTCCTGKIQAFALNGSSGSEQWTSHGQNLFGEAPSLEFGTAVSISDNGAVLAGAGSLYTSLYRFNADPSRWNEFVYEQKMPGIIMPVLSQDGLRMVARTITNSVTMQGYMGAQFSPKWRPLGRKALDSTIAGTISGHAKRMVTVTSQFVIMAYRYEPTQNYLNHVGQALYMENPNSDPTPNVHVSASMSLQGDIFAIGYKNNVRAYRQKNREWSLIAEEISGSDSDNGGYGYDISVSDRGSRIAIGSPFYDNNRGRVEVFHVYREVWTKICDTIDGEESGAHAGYAVSLAPDGYHVAVGSPFIGSSSHVGNVRVYELIPLFGKEERAAAVATTKESQGKTTRSVGGHDTDQMENATVDGDGQDNASGDRIDDAGTLNNNDGAPLPIDIDTTTKSQSLQHDEGDDEEEKTTVRKDNSSNDEVDDAGTLNKNGAPTSPLDTDVTTKSKSIENNNMNDEEEKITVSNIYSFFKNKLFGGL